MTASALQTKSRVPSCDSRWSPKRPPPVCGVGGERARGAAARVVGDEGGGNGSGGGGGGGREGRCGSPWGVQMMFPLWQRASLPAWLG